MLRAVVLFWTTSPQVQPPLSASGLLQDGENLNNYVEVLGDASVPEKAAMRQRLLSEAGTLTGEEKLQIQKQIAGLH